MLFAKNRFYRNKKVVVGISCCYLVLGLSACVSNDVSDLNRYVQGIKAKPKGMIQPLPEIKVVEPFIFEPAGLRDPFRPIERRQDEERSEFSGGAGIHPDRSRRKEELEGYSLDTLRMVGTLTMDNALWALVKAAEGTIHRVRQGNHMGRNYGEIIRILDDRIELMEIIPDKPGAWREQQASLALAE